MNLIRVFMAVLLAGLASTAPATNTTDDDEVMEINKEFFLPEFVIYTAEHDVVSILLPLNALNFEDDSDVSEETAEIGNVLFFVLADYENGKRVDQGLYVRKNGVVTKLLDNGRDAAAANDDTKTAYFAAKDGLYSYNEKENKAEKYGTLTDSITRMAKVNGSDIIYILTEDHILYKVTEEGMKKEKIENVVNADKIVLDHQNNLYYLTSDKKVFVLGSDGVKKVEGLPEVASYVDIIKPPFVLDDGVPVIYDSQFYVAYPNATSDEITDFRFQVKPTAYSVDATILLYFGYEKKIYEYNILNILSTKVMGEMNKYLENNSETISELATRSRSDLVF